MPIFNYRVLNQIGKALEGAIEAPSIDSAASALTEKGLKIIEIEESRTLFKSSSKLFSLFNKISKKDLVIFSRQLSVMVSATVPIIQALRGISKQTENETLKEIIEKIADDVDGGTRLSNALRRHDIFDNFFVNMVASGESSGRLDEVLNYLADEVEKNYGLQAKIKGAMIYPIFIIVGLIAVGVAMMIFVIPNLTGMLQASGQELPLSTKMLINTSDIFRSYYIFLILGILILWGLIFIFIKKTDVGRQAVNFIKLKFPVFGKLWQNIYLVRFSGTLSSLLSAGVPLSESFRITAVVISNDQYKKSIDKTIDKVEDGYSIADEFSKSDLFPSMLSQMLRVGEKTGKINVVLDKLASFYSREVENMVNNLTSLIEPMIMIIIGIAVGGMVAAIITPMYNLANAF
ncbi:type II secretion system F family protein [bacterium]|nr:type II secretion system F family protein [bacterium]